MSGIGLDVRDRVRCLGCGWMMGIGLDDGDTLRG